MSVLLKSAYIFRGIIWILSVVALGSCVWLHMSYKKHRTLIARWKFFAEFALAGISVAAYPISYFVRRLGRPRSPIVSAIFIFLGGVLGLGWMYTTFGVIVLRERQVMPADWPTHTDRDQVPDWDNYWSPTNKTIFLCKEDPNSSVGPALSLSLCKFDGLVAAAGAICGVFGLVETMLSALSEQATYRKFELMELNDGEDEYELGTRRARR
ncbi:hypothetical protein DFQ26_009384 [Actinomortierella ambigua]|nr:hypothetical protein DFQ26_009384 [Actinomortierella ambigua]